jgi:enoyl-CoA hydratase|tara:strand:- start:190 stop:606 length:417 start_codon:yes stop_codon:yes gene_type:complete
MINDKLKIGDRASIIKRFVDEDILIFSELSNDKNPIHLDSNFASKTNFGRKIVHGMLIASLFSGLLGEKLPGKGTIYLGQTITFIKPVFINEEVTASVEIQYIRKDKPIYTLKTICETKLNGIVVDGEAIVKNSIQSG